jgi:SNF family Na+-dependent transporter
VKGIKSSGKAVYVTAVFPYVVLIVLFFRGVTLEGAGKGVAFLFTPDWSTLYDPVVWLEAAGQIFYSLSVAFGALITYTSYSDPSKRPSPLKDTLTVTFINCGTSVFASIVIFAILGFKAKGRPIAEVASGPGLAFVAFSEALGQMPGAPFWSVIFFLMLITLAIDSMFGTLEVPLTDILDEMGHRWPFLTKARILLILNLSGLLLGLMFVLQSGYYSFQLFNTYSGSLPLLFVALCECISVAWVYGVERSVIICHLVYEVVKCCHVRFGSDLETITGHFPKRAWLYMWKYVSPLVITMILLGSIIKQGITPITYDVYKNYSESTADYPSWALLCAALIILVIVAPIPIIVLFHYFRRCRMRKEYSTGTMMEDITSRATYLSLDDAGSR